MLGRRCRTIYRWVEAGDDEVGSSTDCDAGDGTSSRDVEHEHLAIGEGYEAELPVVGDGYGLRRTAQMNDTGRFPRGGGGACDDGGKDVELVVLFIRDVHLASDGVIIHEAKLPCTEQGTKNAPGVEVDGYDGTLAGGDIGGKASGDGDVLWPSGNGY